MSAQPDLRAFFFSKSKLSSTITGTIEELVDPIFQHIPVNDSDGMMQLEKLKQAALQVSGQMTGAIDDLVEFISKRFYSSDSVVPPSKVILGESAPSNTGSIDAASAVNSTPKVPVVKEEPEVTFRNLKRTRYESDSGSLPELSTSRHSSSHSREHSTENDQGEKRSRSDIGGLWPIAPFYATSVNTNSIFLSGNIAMHRRHHSESLSTTSSSSGTSEKVRQYIPRSFQCGIDGCEANLKTNSLLHKHWLNEHSVQMYRCPLRGCKKSFGSQGLQLDHINAHHTDPFKCRHDQCPFLTKNPQSLLYHQHMSHQAGEFECTACSDVFNYAADVMHHYNYCRANKRY